MPLHPFIETMLKNLAGRPALSAGSPQDARDLLAAGRAVLGAGPEMHEVRNISITTRNGAIGARLLKPVASPHGLIVYLHGGGWVVGALDDFDPFARTLATESGCTVLLPDYRLAPEHPFPAGFEDCEDSLLWANSMKSQLASDGPTIVAGDSAGANLATVIARSLQGKVDVALQVMIYPVTDCDFTTTSYGTHGQGLPLTGKDMEWFFRHYAPKDVWQRPEISPLGVTGLKGLPPAVIVTAEYDVLASEGRAYAERLREAGVPVEFREVPGMTHGFIRLHNLLDVAQNEVKAIAARIAAVCKNGSN